jgi:hypothetical protein
VQSPRSAGGAWGVSPQVDPGVHPALATSGPATAVARLMQSSATPAATPTFLVFTA